MMEAREDILKMSRASENLAEKMHKPPGFPGSTLR